MGEHAFIGMVAQQSVPIQGITPLFNSADYKKNLAMKNSAELADRLRNNVTEYNNRMIVFRENLAKQTLEGNQTEAERRLQNIWSQNLTKTNDPRQLQYGLNDLASFFRFNQFNNIGKTFDNQIYAARQLQVDAIERQDQLKKGEETASTSTNRNIAGFYFNEKTDMLC